jgi:hypothetical protein
MVTTGSPPWTAGATSGPHPSRASGPGGVAAVNHAVAETAFVQQFELHADMVGERLVTASHHDGHEEQLPLVDQSGLEAWAARSGPPTVRSRSADAFSCRTASGSKSRSIRVAAVDIVSSVLEYTILSAACQISAKSRMTRDWSAKVCAVSQGTITSYIRRP